MKHYPSLSDFSLSDDCNENAVYYTSCFAPNELDWTCDDIFGGTIRCSIGYAYIPPMTDDQARFLYEVQFMGTPVEVGWTLEIDKQAKDDLRDLGIKKKHCASIFETNWDMFNLHDIDESYHRRFDAHDTWAVQRIISQCTTCAGFQSCVADVATLMTKSNAFGFVHPSLRFMCVLQ